MFLGGAGGFSTSGKPYSFLNRTDSSLSSGVGWRNSIKKDLSLGEKNPDHVFEGHSQPSQALLYRLSEDYNPLYSDPLYAKNSGFPQPILHGLCTLGYATRTIIACLCGGELWWSGVSARSFRAARISRRDLIPGMWKDEGQNRVDYKLKVRENNKVVLAGSITLGPTFSRLRKTVIDNITAVSLLTQ